MAVEPLERGVRLGAREGRDARYVVRRALGAGGFGLTYLATDERLAGPVVIKEFAPETMSSRAAGELDLVHSGARRTEFARALVRFEQESQKLNRIRHANVVRVIDCWRANGTAYYAMDWVPDASPLPQVRPDERQTLGLERVVALLEGVLDGLQAVHAAGLVHGDVKPQNVLRAPGRGPVLIDFGTARTASELEADTVTILYTPGWTAPELEAPNRLHQAGAWSDLYSWGMLAWGMVLGHSSAYGMPATPSERSTGPDPYHGAELRLRQAGLPRGMAAAVAGCMRITPGDRPASVDDVRAISDGSRVAEARAGSLAGEARAPRTPAIQLGRVCLGCLAVSPAYARYCVRCGAELEAAAAPVGALAPAGRLRRLLAGGVDVAIVGGALLLWRGEAWVDTPWLALAVALGVGAVYETLMLAMASATAGQLALGLAVTDAHGNALRPLHALARSLSRSVCDGLGLGPLSYGAALLGAERRSFADALAATRVIETRGARR